MGHNWIIDVLADLKSFAQENELVKLAANLERITNVAAAEIASISQVEPQRAVNRDEEDIKQAHSKFGTSDRA